jgi:hypothetical protein
MNDSSYGAIGGSKGHNPNAIAPRKREGHIVNAKRKML